MITDDNKSVISSGMQIDQWKPDVSGYSYRRPNVDNRFKMLSEQESDETEGGFRGRALPLSMQISNYDRKLLEYIINMHNVLRGDKIAVDDFANIVDALQHMKNEQEWDYLNALVHPEKAKGAKIPSTIPIPSSSFQLHNSIQVTTNASGNACIMFNPFYLGTAGTLSTLYVNNNAGLTGSASSNFFIPTNIGQTIPAVYNEYRAVSASIVVKYVGRLDIVQGVIGGAIVFDQNITANDYVAAAANANLAKYGDFNLAMDSFYTQENLTLNGIRELFFPLDNTFEQYTTCGTAKTGFGCMVYILGGVPSSPAYKVDIYVNYECLPDSAFLNYIPTNMCTSSPDRKQEAVKIVQQNPITDESAARTPLGGSESFWDRVKKTLGAFLPGVKDLAGSLLPMLAPAQLKPLMSVAGTLISQTPGKNSIW